MSLRTLNLDNRLYHYLLDHSLRENPLLAELRQVTAQLPEAGMQISPEQGQFMQFLVRAIGARRCLEVGVFTGYSALAVALALPDDGSITACDLNQEWTHTAERFWRRAGVDQLITLHIAPALQTLDTLISQGASASYDFAFVDADKGHYLDYYDRCLTLMRPGGVIAFDNTLWSGAVADAAINDEDTRAIRALNDHLHQDTRIDLSLVPIGDGLTLARKIPL